MVIRALKLIISGILLFVWLICTMVMLLFATLSVMGLALLMMCPELFLLWCLPALFLLVVGGWISDETANELKEALTKESEEDRGDDFIG